MKRHQCTKDHGKNADQHKDVLNAGLGHFEGENEGDRHRQIAYQHNGGAGKRVGGKERGDQEENGQEEGHVGDGESLVMCTFSAIGILGTDGFRDVKVSEADQTAKHENDENGQIDG